LSSRGFYVIRFDNRDVGLSSKIDHFGIEKIMEVNKKVEYLKTVPEEFLAQLPYSLRDMADDSLGLLDELQIEKAHIIGFSMGGMIAQEIAISHPKRVLSLTSVMSTTGEPHLPSSTPEVSAAVAKFSTPASTREGVIEQNVEISKLTSGPLFNEEERRQMSALLYDRCYYPLGLFRQVLAIRSGLPRKQRLMALKEKENIPIMVIHGQCDNLIPIAHAHDLVNSIPGIQFHYFEEMGHDFPSQLHSSFIDLISKFCKKMNK